MLLDFLLIELRHYLFPLQIDLHSEDSFEVLRLCVELGLPKLQSHVCNHIRTTLSPENVCSVLVRASASLQQQQQEEEEEGANDSSFSQEISKTCLAYIETNSRAVFQSKEFLQLTKELLIIVISSNKVICTVIQKACTVRLREIEY